MRKKFMNEKCLFLLAMAVMSRSIAVSNGNRYLLHIFLCLADDVYILGRLAGKAKAGMVYSVSG